MPDELGPDLLRLFVQGDLDAFESLFKQFEVEVYRWILRIVRDASTAEDVLVEAFWRAYRGRGQFDPSRSFGAWMRRIATNVARDHLSYKSSPRLRSSKSSLTRRLPMRSICPSAPSNRGCFALSAR